MLEPRDTDIWALFLLFIVLPLASYVLLGKWNETMEGKKRRNFIVTQETEEALLVENMAVDGVLQTVSMTNNGFHKCSRCFSTATTRCSQCKSVWYCSGRCQISHWRQVHKLECQPSGNNCQISSSKCISPQDCCIKVSHGKTTDPNMLEYNVKHPGFEKTSSNDVSSLPPIPNVTRMTADTCGKHIINESSIKKTPCVIVNGDDHQERTFHKSSTYASGVQMDLAGGELLVQNRNNYCDETEDLKCSPESTSMKRSNKTRTVNRGIKQQKSAKLWVKTSKANNDESSDATIKDNIHLQGINKVVNHGIMRMMGSMKPTKHDHRQHSGDGAKNLQKVKMLFPYEEFVKCFQLEILNLSPRGLVNCGNSCYANAVLQCLTFTKPLITYLLRQSHSKAGCSKGWCLICELERHVMKLSEIGCPLSTRNILMHIRSLNSQIGNGSQEDAHEFLRLIIASMQSICLESLGGEKVVDPRLQDTTFVQHTFGGRLKSKVKCLRCHQESVRHENIMDLTLEIFGWVESLEDALTQFTSSEDLDGENMYRCGRCSSYVRARKQLSIKEAPNILTIVLKRFQEGNYGKLNKRITFPEILDMVPFMTGKDDIPPSYMLYAVVVHLNSSNESSSGHYISYVKDLRGNWFRVDDVEVLPAQLSQVTSEGAYILFYIRSHPRPFRGHGRKATCQQSLELPLPKSYSCLSKPEKSAWSKLSPNLIEIYPYLDRRLEANTENSRSISARESRNSSKFSDATSSDWSAFTNSDNASFSTESTRDSLSTVDHSDVIPFSSMFQSLYPAESTYHVQLVSQ